MITKMLVSAAILGSVIAGAAPAGADPSQSDQNIFGSLTCNCQQTPPAGGASQSDDIERGLRAGFAAG
ncbi:hypothetical protein A5745_01750 [Mycobacterium sp. IS-2888]|uniref:hypothetical protein n=1 Tax=Mycobacterium sp. IS-1264 TaxID=1834158 RepID=UPI00096D51A3|nr:hypothetical protein [Mycobacterium sp. IS-1264]OMC49170.1 hypothetical protein A5744_03995 [Mycobacterium sp. IS-1264]OMC52290.1 hypothetical protein A5745_01750 [Mycobacterium sp. IS-2888]